MANMKLVSLNIAIKQANSDRVSDFLEQQGADIVALQEVVRHLDAGVSPTYRSKQDIERALAPAYPYTFFGPVWVGNGFKTPTKVDYDFGGHIEQGCEVLIEVPNYGRHK